MKKNGKNGYLTVGQTAKEFGVSRQAVHQWIDSGYLNAIWMLEQWAVHEAEVERVKELRNESETAAA